MTAVTGVTGKQKQAPPRFRRHNRHSRHSRPLDLGATPSGTSLRRAGGRRRRKNAVPGRRFLQNSRMFKSRISWSAIAAAGCKGRRCQRCAGAARFDAPVALGPAVPRPEFCTGKELSRKPATNLGLTMALILLGF